MKPPFFMNDIKIALLANSPHSLRVGIFFFNFFLKYCAEGAKMTPSRQIFTHFGQNRATNEDFSVVAEDFSVTELSRNA
jgi:hypothetical protein